MRYRTPILQTAERSIAELPGDRRSRGRRPPTIVGEAVVVTLGVALAGAAAIFELGLLEPFAKALAGRKDPSLRVCPAAYSFSYPNETW